MTLFSSSKLKGRMSYIGSVVIFHGSFDKMLKITKINTDVSLTVFVCTVWVVPDYLLRPIFAIREIVLFPKESFTRTKWFGGYSQINASTL